MKITDLHEFSMKIVTNLGNEILEADAAEFETASSESAEGPPGEDGRREQRGPRLPTFPRSPENVSY